MGNVESNVNKKTAPIRGMCLRSNLHFNPMAAGSQRVPAAPYEPPATLSYFMNISFFSSENDLPGTHLMNSNFRRLVKASPSLMLFASSL